MELELVLTRRFKNGLAFAIGASGTVGFLLDGRSFAVEVTSSVLGFSAAILVGVPLLNRASGVETRRLARLFSYHFEDLRVDTNRALLTLRSWEDLSAEARVAYRDDLKAVQSTIEKILGLTELDRLAAIVPDGPYEELIDSMVKLRLAGYPSPEATPDAPAVRDSIRRFETMSHHAYAFVAEFRYGIGQP